MDPLEKLQQTVRELLAADVAPGGGAGVRPGLSARQAAQMAAREALMPRHAFIKQTQIVEVGPAGRIPQRSQQFFREGHGLREVHTDARVLTHDGRLVSPEAIVLRCPWCHGYTSQAFYCGCGIGICGLCIRKLVMPNGKIQILCPEHYRVALDQYNVWQAMDHRGQP
jgi:hypothetical protein